MSFSLVSKEIDLCHTQAVLVLSEKKTDVKAKVWLFDREKSWTCTKGPLKAVLGKNGLAWGNGLHGEAPTGSICRREGSLTAPIGIYPITTLFGLENQERVYNSPYIHFTASMKLIDDPLSKYYNLIIDENEVKKDWNSAENLGEIELYELGAVIDFNPRGEDKEAGSGIFLHVWRGENQGTAGCTALSEEDVRKIAHWLNFKKNPILIQMDRETYKTYEALWGLPKVSF